VEWNQWAEVVGRDARQPRFVGDMPHGWIASDYIRSVLDMFAYERYADHSIALGAGVRGDWLRGQGIAIARLPTPYGDLGYSLRGNGETTELNVDAGSAVPPGGFVYAWPGGGPPPEASINGRAAQWEGDELHIRELPARVLIKGRVE